jgi:hypothetical protein
MKKVLYNDCYGGFGISEEGIELLINEFPEKASNYGWKIKKRPYNFVRDDQEVIEFMINTGLKKFQGKHCELDIEEINPLLKFEISEYDGYECVEKNIDYKNIICDLINRIKGCDVNDQSPVTEMMISKGYEDVMEILNK